MVTRGVSVADHRFEAGHVLAALHLERVHAGKLAAGRFEFDLVSLRQFRHRDVKTTRVRFGRVNFSLVDFSAGDHIEHPPLHVIQGITTVVTYGSLIFVGHRVANNPRFGNAIGCQCLRRDRDFVDTGRQLTAFHNGRCLHDVFAGRHSGEVHRRRVARTISAHELIVAFASQLKSPGVDVLEIIEAHVDRTVVDAVRGMHTSAGLLHLVFDAQRVGVELGGRTLGEPFHGVVAGLHIGHDGRIHPVLHYIFRHNGTGRLVLDLVGDVGNNLPPHVNHTQIHICTRSTTTAESRIGTELIGCTVQIIFLYWITAGGLDTKAIVITKLGGFDVAHRITCQRRHHARINEGLTVVLVNLVSRSVEEGLENGRIFDTAGAGVFYGNARYRLCTTKICSQFVITVHIKRTFRRDFRPDGKIC